jgi:hypothetical protein
MNSPLENRKVRLRKLGGPALYGVRSTCASATGDHRIRSAPGIIEPVPSPIPSTGPMRRSFLRLVLACAVLPAGVPAAAHAQDWSRYAEAANVITFRDTALYLDSAQLERVRRGLERSRAAFPELRRIVARGPGATLASLLYQFPDSVRQSLVRRAAEAGLAARADGRVVIALARTGYLAFDSLNARFGAVDMVVPVDPATGALERGGLLEVRFSRPVNSGRLEGIYAAAGIVPDIHSWDLTGSEYPYVGWVPGADADVFRFGMDSECFDPCRRRERYVVRVPLDGGAVQMLEREVTALPHR